MFVMTKKILKVNEPKSYDFISAMVTGRRGIGKTSYCIQLVRQYYQIKYDLSKDEAYQYALKSIIFSLDEMINLMKNHNWKNRVDVVIFDDCGIFTSGMMYSSFQKEFAMLRASLDGIRSITGALLLTAPDVHSTAKFIQSYEHLIVKVTKEPVWLRLAKGYQKYRTAFGKTYTRKLFEDTFSAYIPKRWFIEYMDLREAHKQELIKQLEKMKTKNSKKALEILESETI